MRIAVLRSCPDAALEKILPLVRRAFGGRRILLLETSSRPSLPRLPKIRLSGRRFRVASVSRALASLRGIEAAVLPYNEADPAAFRPIEEAIHRRNIPLYGVDGRRDLPSAARRRLFLVPPLLTRGFPAYERSRRKKILRALAERPVPPPRAEPREEGPLRILVVGDLSIAHVRDWCVRMRDLGCRIAAASPKTRARIRGVRVVDLGWPDGIRHERPDLFAAWWHDRLAERRLPARDLTVAFFTGLIPAAMTGDRPLVYAAMGDDVLTHPGRILGWRSTMRAALRRVDLALTPDAAPVRRALIELGLPARRIHPGTTFGVDLGSFPPGPPPVRRPPWILFSRGFDSIYRVEELLRAVPRIRSERPDARFLLTGRGAAPARAPRGVRVLGYLSAGRLPSLYRRARIYLSIPRSDGTPRSLLEAMASGAVPVLADLPSYRIWTGSAGAVRISRATPREIARGVLRALRESDAGAWDARVRENRRRVARRGDAGANDRRILAAFRALTRRRGASRTTR